MKKSPTISVYILLAVIIVALGAIGYLVSQNKKIQEEGFKAQEVLKAELEQVRAEFASTSKTLGDTIAERDDLKQKLIAEQTRLDVLAAQVGAITGTVGILEKIQRTDPELLQKYSKVYFLNEHYTPERLAQIDKKHVLRADEDEFFQADVWHYLESLFQAAKMAGIDIKILSAYRSFGTQAQLKSTYTVIYGSGANQFSADQGYSEHQLGTAVDFTDTDIGAALLGFENSPAYAWLTANAYKYGFALSYPKDNTYYEFEPWHWRFVGKKLAQALHAESIHFYDMDQREIDTYLVSFFD
jgi:LAS superfamily LD-carboxypeptidase LdcB